MTSYVIKYGGAAMTDPLITSKMLGAIAKLVHQGERIVLVHGGGPEIDNLLKRLSIQPKRERGLRITDAQTMEVAEMVLSGKLNKDIVSKLNLNKVKAIGLSGRDAHLMLAKRKVVPGIELGLVGDVCQVNADLLSLLIANGYIPVISSIAEDDTGLALNINADEAAAAIAVALQVDNLIFLTDVPGLLANYPDPKSLIQHLSVNEAETFFSSGKLDSGMLPKVGSCISAIKAGVKHARIVDGRLGDILLAMGAGTTISYPNQPFS